MTEQAFKKNWDDLSFNRPNSFQKLDTILKNPAPPNIAISVVLNQISNFCQQSLNLKVFSDGNRIQAAGQAQFKPPSQTSFPQNPNEMQPPTMIPLMLEAQFYDEDTSEFRLSIRAPPSNNLAVAIVNLLKLFMYPQSN